MQQAPDKRSKSRYNIQNDLTTTYIRTPVQINNGEKLLIKCIRYKNSQILTDLNTLM